MIKVKMLQTVAGADRDYDKDTEYTFEDAQAKALVAKGRAVEVKAAGGAGAAELVALTQEVKAAVVQGFSQGCDEGGRQFAKTVKGLGPRGGSVVHQGEYTSADANVDGLAVFNSNGGFLHAIKEAAGANPAEDSIRKLADWKDMQRKAGIATEVKGAGSPSGNYEASDPDGGVLVIPEFSQTIYERAQLEENFLARANNLTVRGNTMTLPALDDASRVDGSRYGAVQGYWANEAEQYANASRPKYRSMDLRLKKLYIIAYVTDELLADSAFALESYVTRYAAKELVFKTNDAMIRGPGGGMPLGIINSPSAISVAKETGQAAATVLLQNIEKMWMRLNFEYRKDAEWLINQDCEAALQLMAFPVGIAGVPIYQPQGGVANPAYSTLKGRPVKVVEYAETLGTVGDIILTNWNGYQAITKGGVKTDISMHVRFLFGEMAYRFTYRMDGQPLWDKPLTPYKGTTTTSTTVVLATRA